MYGYVEIEKDESVPKKIFEIVEEYSDVVEAFKPKPSNELPTKEWNEFLDNYLTGKPLGSPDIMEKLSSKQSFVISEIRKSKKRN